MKSEVRSQKSEVKTIKGMLVILSSREFLIWIVGGWIVFYVFSAIWMKEAFANFISGLQGGYLIKTPFLLFLISGYMNIVRASREKFSRGKKYFLSWIFLPLGIMIFFTGFFISITTRQFEWLLVGQEDIVQPKWSKESYKVVEFRPGIKERFLDMDQGKETGGIFAFEPAMRFQDRQGNIFEAGAFPPAKFNETYFHILNFGLAPGVRLLEDGIVKDEGYMVLRIIKPGSSDSFEIKPYPYKFIISLEPERIIKKGRAEAAEYNVREPKFKVRVYEGEKVIAETVSKEGMEFRNFKLTFFEPTFWIQLEIVRDYGYPVIISGLFLVLAGLPVYVITGLAAIFFRRARPEDTQVSSD